MSLATTALFSESSSKTPGAIATQDAAPMHKFRSMTIFPILAGFFSPTGTSEIFLSSFSSINSILQRFLHCLKYERSALEAPGRQRNSEKQKRSIRPERANVFDHAPFDKGKKQGCRCRADDASNIFK